MRHERAVNSSASAGFPTHVYAPSVNYMQVCLFALPYCIRSQLCYKGLFPILALCVSYNP